MPKRPKKPRKRKCKSRLKVLGSLGVVFIHCQSLSRPRDGSHDTGALRPW